MKTYLWVIAACLFSTNLYSAGKLTFRQDGKFKIMQITDTHYEPQDKRSQAALVTIKKALEQESPDLVVFTGDIVTGKPVAEGWKAVLSLATDRHIPFLVTLGNHDDEMDLDRWQVAECVTQYAGCLNTVAVRGVKGVMNDVTPVMNRNGEPALLIYTMDSNGYSPDSQIAGYAWFEPDQVEWYKKMSLNWRKKSRQGVLSALAFFHIPLQEHRRAFFSGDSLKSGSRTEDEYEPNLNTGLFAAMYQSGDVIGIFTGHNHNNNYVASLFGIALGFGRFTGGKNTYTYTDAGVRLIELTEGTRTFTTWVRMYDGAEKDKMNFVSQQKIDK